jgi:DNA polymerase-3 subunit gamma/tau
MEYKVLYRKYRPQSFDEIIGQEHITTVLKNAIKHNSISHAYIFSGPRGTGKTSAAKIFAKAVNCEDNKNSNPCGKCISCKTAETSSDIIELDAASNNGVDEIREINENVKILPASLKYKVYIIDEVHMLTRSAFNALLKTLEEPPKHVIFILATTNVEAIPITIISRCQRFDFKKLKDKDILKNLENIVKKEKINIAKDALEEIAYLSDGGMRDALGLLDQLSTEKEITIDNITKLVGNVSLVFAKEILKSLEEENKEEIIKKINELKENSSDYKIVVKNLINAMAEKLTNDDYDQITINKFKNLTFDLIKYLNEVNVNVDEFETLKIILLTNLNKEEVVKEDPVKEKEVQTKTEPKETVKKTEFSFEALKEVRVNNCFVQVKKEEKEKHHDLWESFKKGVKTPLKGL